MIEINNTTRSRINTKLVKIITQKFLKKYNVENRNISIAFIGDRVMKRLNNQYRGKDRVTDILSFPEDGEDFGEIIIDYAQIKRQSLKYSKSVKDELVFILVHGLLHLIGHEDKTERGRKQMEKLGEEFIRKNLRDI